MKDSINQPLLIVEDSDEDFEAFLRIISEQSLSNPVYRCLDGQEALNFLYHQEEYTDPTLSPRPVLIILDLNLPGTDGRDLLVEIKQDNDLKSIPVVVFSSSSNPKDINDCYQYGVNGYIVKPMDTNYLRKLIQILLNYWFKAVVLPTP
jgi:CheY-like chemotaxis protein